ncbi:lumenal Hsp70 protein [Entomophthora muscae]|uniref:Lumenal Hsp70 protein n=1 Tax=Entomophthora muscae TaxID=34485 RepID=A0ACC2RMC3_9FUNG|nr:lumenal Hsp70 protein [Entomophthora muscae]
MKKISKSVWNRFEQCENRGTLVYTADDGAKYSIEELTAMMLQYANEEGKTAAEESIKDTVLTTSAFSSQFERQALLDAGEIAGINVLSLVNDGSAVALNYAMTRKFSAEPQTHIIYDMGSGNTAATLATFKEITVKEGKYRKNVTFTQVEILGVGYDKTLGGNVFDDRVKELLLEKFAAKHPAHKDNILQSPRSVLKLQKEATRVKQVLSANNDAYSSIESIYEDIDFKAIITRTAFEEASSDLFDRVLGPIKDALAKGKLQITDINSIILFGGGVRVPKVHTILKEFIGADKISQNVNGDEAAALGAVFRGAGMSSQFKVKDIRLKERTMYPVELVVAPESEDLEKSGKRHTLFEANAPYVDSFFLPLKLNSDFNFRLQYGESSNDATSGTGCSIMADGQVRGLAPILEQHKDRILEEPKLRVLVSMSTSGIVSVVRAQVVLQLKPLVVPDTNATAEVKNETKAEANKKVTEKFNLEMSLSYPCFKPLSKAEKTKSIQKLRVLTNLDKERFARDESRNKLESFVYSTPEYLEKEEVVGVTTDSERATLSAAVEKASEWLSDEADDATKKVLDDKLSELEKLKNPIIVRLRESQKRPAALESLRSSLDGIDLYQNTMTSNLTVENKAILAPTIEKINAAVKKTAEWLKTSMDAQEKLASYDTPVIYVKDIEAKQKELDSLKFRLIREIIALPPLTPPKPDPKEESKDKPTDKAGESPKEDAEANPSEEDEL